MNDLRTLAFTVAGAIGLSLIYAIAFGGQRIDIESDKAEGRSVQHVVSGDRGEFELRDGDYSIAAEWKGDIKLNAAGDGLDALDNWLEIQETAQGVERMLEYRFEDGQIIRRFSAGDAESDDENAAAEMFLRFLRASGLKADERVGALLQSGTPADVVA